MADDKLESNLDDWMEELTEEDTPFAGGDESATEAPADSEAEEAPNPPGENADPLDQGNIDALFGTDTEDKPAENAASAEEDAEPLDQSDIDSLFGGDSAEQPPAEEASTVEASEGVESADEDPGPVDQNEVDQLLAAGTEDESSAETTEPEAIAAEEPAEEDTGPLDQSDIDSLFGGGAAEEPLAAEGQEPAAEEDAGPLEQADLDALFNSSPGDETPVAAATAPAAEAENPQFDIDAIDDHLESVLSPAASESETPPEEPAGDDQLLDQDDLDQLLGGAGDLEEGAVSPSQTEMDRMFAGAQTEEEDLFPAEQEKAEESFGFAGDELDDGAGDDDLTTVITDEDELEELEEIEEPDEEGGRKFPAMPVWLQKAANSRATWTTIGLCILLSLGSTWLFKYFKRSADEPAISTSQIAQQELEAPAPKSTGGPAPSPEMQHLALEQTTAPLEAAKPQPPASTTMPPAMMPTMPTLPAATPATVAQVTSPLSPATGVESDMKYAMEKPDTPLALALPNQGILGDRLEYLLTALPKHGQLSGEMPLLSYEPGPSFTGEDRFVYRVSDGQKLSPTSTVLITGPPSTQKATALAPKKEKSFTPRIPLVMAQDINLQTLSTAGLNIDWATLWQQANDKPFNRKVEVEIIGKHLPAGTLKRISRERHRFEPDPYSSGQARLDYRFKMAGITSKIRHLTIDVKQGDPPPKLGLRPLADKIFMVGDTVVLDAGSTKDDNPATLIFEWQQKGGVPLRFEQLNQAGSTISFVVPSYFYTVEYPEPTIVVTAIDKSGQRSSKEIAIKVRQNRMAALWTGIHDQDGRLPLKDVALRDRPTNLLPWSSGR